MTDVGIDGFSDAEIIGRGAFGSVYRATQADLDRPVAIKIFQGAPDDQSLNDFLRECRALGALDWCGNIITVFGTGRTRHGEPYLAMEYCPGGSLSTHLTEGATMSEAQVRHIAAEVGTAIQIAHDAGILHRDIKPANILLSRSGAPVLADFGIARLANSSTRSTGISGTIAFTAPEILNGEAATRQADIYSYGATLYSLLTGRSPHALTDRDTTQTMIVRAVSGEGADLTTLPISDDFRAVLARCLERMPTGRYTDMHEVLRDLASLDAFGRQEEPKPPEVPNATYPWPDCFYLPSQPMQQPVRSTGPGERWPSATEYVASIQLLASPLPSTAGLGDVRLATDQMGMPASASGQNAVVFEILHAGGSAAARFFTRPPGQARAHYEAISCHLRTHPMAIVSPARWFDEGIVVRGQPRPLVLMPWIPGSPLNLAVEDRLHDRMALLALTSTWLEVMRSLADSAVAHGDLQCGNVLIDDGGNIRLVDLDGFYVPGMTTCPDELGHPNFQHPARQASDWGPEMDGTSAAIIALSLRALAFDPGLWEFHNGENLVLSVADLRAAGSTPVWQRLRASADELVRRWADQVAEWCSQNYPPTMSEVLEVLTGRPKATDSPARTIRRAELPSTSAAGLPVAPSPRTPQPAPWWDEASIRSSPSALPVVRSHAPSDRSLKMTAPTESTGAGQATTRAPAGSMNASKAGATKAPRTRFNSVVLGALGGYFGGLFALLLHVAFLKDTKAIDGQSILVLFVTLICAFIAAGPRAFSSLLLRDFSGALRSGLTRALLGAAMGLSGLAVFQGAVNPSRFVGDLRAPAWMLVLAWCLVGAGVGLAVGVVRRNGRALMAGVLGGFLGGAVGGLIHASLGEVRFDHDEQDYFIHLTTSEPRTWVAVLAAGTVIGAAIGLASQATKTFWLTVLEGPQRGLEVILDGKEASIGSAGSDTVRLPAAHAKARHVRLTRTSNGAIDVTFTHEGALNGKNCVAGTTHSAASGDVVRIGGAFLRLDQRS